MTGHLQQLYRRSSAVHFGFTEEDFAQILTEIATAHLAGTALGSERLAFYQSLKVDDLLLAQACVRGNTAAWEHLATNYRPRLVAMARKIATGEGTPDELADSVLSDLFRLKKLRYYSGRSSLEGWLRAVVAQEYVNRQRTLRKLVPVDEADLANCCAQQQAPARPHPLLAEALDAALLSLRAEERLLLSAHYLDRRSLVEVGRLLCVHETTAARRLSKTLHRIRQETVRYLVRHGVHASAAKEALDCDVTQLEIDVQSRLLAVREA